ncbi:MAG: hypothetical protein Q9227_004522 [Pyrenula ochraceoflavens]
MRLIHTEAVELEDFSSNEIPPYSDLSHTWGEEEVAFHEFNNAAAKLKKGYEKISDWRAALQPNRDINISGSILVALFTLTTNDNALRKGWHMPTKVAAECYVGGKVSMSPLEVAKALHTPSTSKPETEMNTAAQSHDVLSIDVDQRNQQAQVGSNLPADELVELLGTKKVKYGEVGPNVLGMGLSEYTLAPRKGWRYR